MHYLQPPFSALFCILSAKILCKSFFLILFFVIQIADFGMSRDLDDQKYYITSGGKIPVKWTAPEVSQLFFDMAITLLLIYIGPPV